jgi:peptidoglycan/LPS O-acetylase OafA/YrhL
MRGSQNAGFSLPYKQGTIPQLDAIRALAMLSIFTQHLWLTVIANPQTTLQEILKPLFTRGSDGVVVFNLISGFLLAMPHLGRQQRPFEGYASFLRKRFFRIIPPYYLALLLFTAGNMLRFDFPLVPALALLAQHLFFVNSLNYSNMLTNFAQFWYLGLLAQFYLTFPFILGLFRRAGPTRAALSIIALCWGSWIIVAWRFPEAPESWPDIFANLMHFNLPGRLPEFAIGMWLASIWEPPASIWRSIASNRAFSAFCAAAAIYVIASIPFVKAMNLPLIHIHDVPLCMLFFFLFLSPFGARMGKSAILRNFSSHSYSIYIVHQPLFSYVGVMPATVAHNLGNFALLAVLLLPLAYLSATILDGASASIVKFFKRVDS